MLLKSIEGLETPHSDTAQFPFLPSRRPRGVSPRRPLRDTLSALQHQGAAEIILEDGKTGNCLALTEVNLWDGKSLGRKKQRC